MKALGTPNDEDVLIAAGDLGLTLGEGEVREFREMVAGAVDALRPLEDLTDSPTVSPYRRPEWREIALDEDPLHGWYVKMSVRGAASGPLSGRGVVLKDNVCLAGAPMIVGAETMEGYVADEDATVVTRILDAGGEILGKAHCEYFCYSAGSHTNATGPTHNPYRRGYSAGGSSSGCAALVGAGEVEMAIGGDQGGSIRQPSAMCGVYGMKPTYGLVPYTGAFPVDHTLDHLGPMSSSVEANALLLEVIAGEDGIDPRQRSVRVSRYTDALGLGVDGVRIGVLREGFGHPNTDPGVDASVSALGDRLLSAGASVVSISVPMHLNGAVAIWAAIAIEGTAELAMRDNGIGAGHGGRYMLSMLAWHADWPRQANRLSEPLKAGLIAAHYLRTNYHGLYYAKAQNLVPQLRAAYDRVFEEVDLLLMPTIPFTAPPHPRGTSPSELSAPGFEAVVNTAPFNVTGHPAMSIPCGMLDGLPIGAMLVGRHWEEGMIYRTAAVVEALGDWHGW